MRIGIDLGGTKTEVVALNEQGEGVFRQRAPTPRESYQSIVETIVSLVHKAEVFCGPRDGDGSYPVGVGIPGTIRKNGLVKNANTTVLIDKPFKEDLSAALDRPVQMANDANCFALSEAIDGAAKGFDTVFGVILGTGCGGGLVVDGKILNGVNGIAGEWGHNPLASPTEDELPGSKCYCGRAGCTETFISGTGFSLDYKNLSGQNLVGQEIVRLAEQGDPQAVRCIERLEHRIAKSLAVVINIVDPDAIVLGGGVSNIARLYDSVPQLWGAYVFSDVVETKLLKAQYGDSSGVRGAAWL